MGKDIAQFASFMDGAWSSYTHVTWYATWSGELAKQVFHPFGVLGNLRIDLGVGSFEVHIGNDCRSTMTGSSKIDHVDILLLDKAI